MEQRLKVVGKTEASKIEYPELITQMDTIIDDMNAYALNKGAMGGLDWGMQCFNDIFEGFEAGLYFIGGPPNVGKSALCVQLAWTIAQANRVKTQTKPHLAYVLYLSLDDSVKKILPRVVALDQRIPIGVVTKPRRYEPDPGARQWLARRDIGIRRLKESIPYFKVADTNYIPMIDTLESIRKTIDEHHYAIREVDDDYRLVVFVDNYHDISTTENFYGDTNARIAHIAHELSEMTKKYDIPIICTAELKKIGSNRRPGNEDIKDTVKTSYESDATLLCYNEVGNKGEASQIYWQAEGRPERQPVLEVMISKNKISSNKRRVFFEFMPEMSYLREATIEGTKRYNAIISG